MRKLQLFAGILSVIAAFQISISCEAVLKKNPSYNIIIDTDLGGDPDDIQSLFRAVHYSDILKIKGIVATPCNQIRNHPWDTVPRIKLI